MTALISILDWYYISWYLGLPIFWEGSNHRPDKFSNLYLPRFISRPIPETNWPWYSSEYPVYLWKTYAGLMIVEGRIRILSGIQNWMKAFNQWTRNWIHQDLDPAEPHFWWQKLQSYSIGRKPTTTSLASPRCWRNLPSLGLSPRNLDGKISNQTSYHTYGWFQVDLDIPCHILSDTMMLPIAHHIQTSLMTT